MISVSAGNNATLFVCEHMAFLAARVMQRVPVERDTPMLLFSFLLILHNTLQFIPGGRVLPYHQNAGPIHSVTYAFVHDVRHPTITNLWACCV